DRRQVRSANLHTRNDQPARGDDLRNELGVRAEVSHIVDQAGQEQQGAATKQPEQTRVKSNEDNDRERRGNVDSNTAQKRGGLLEPAILSWLRHYAACASERGNKWRYDDRDAEGETKADCEQVYRGQMQHYADAQTRS